MSKKIEQYDEVINKNLSLKTKNIDIGKENFKNGKKELENLYSKIVLEIKKEDDKEKLKILKQKKLKISKELNKLHSQIPIKKPTPNIQSLKGRDPQIVKNILEAKNNMKKIIKNAKYNKNFIARLAGKGLDWLQGDDTT